MFTLLKSLRKKTMGRLIPTTPSRRQRSWQPRFEALEDRLVPAAITDMTALAQSLPPPTQATHLYLNFDGFKGSYQNENHDVHAFGNDREIQDIIFRVSELFAPFDVEVERISGADQYDAGNGSTTIFVGGDVQNLNWGIAGPYAHSGLYGTDIPSQLHKNLDGNDHAPNSNPFDIAWVDPTNKFDANGNKATDPNQWTVGWDDKQIAQVIAHEAGHTFGLGHVDSLTIPEMMSYTAANTRFDNITFQITTLDNSGKGVAPNDYGLQPVWDGTNITTQNSFTYLQAMLGARPDDGEAHVAHAGSVDPAAYVAPTELTFDTPLQGAISRAGEYNAYTFVSYGGQTVISIAATGEQTLTPELLLYNSQGDRVLSQNLAAGQSYRVVVGAHDGVSVGSYQLSVLQMPDVPQEAQVVGPEDPIVLSPDGMIDPQAINPEGSVVNPSVMNPVDGLGELTVIDPGTATVDPVLTNPADNLDLPPMQREDPGAATVFESPASQSKSRFHAVDQAFITTDLAAELDSMVAPQQTKLAQHLAINLTSAFAMKTGGFFMR